MATARGRILYDPRVIVDGREQFDPFWVVLVCPPSILEEARAQLTAARAVRLSRPRWGSHVSVVSGEEPLVPSRWGERDGEEVDFSYADEPEEDGPFHWLPIRCEALFEIRELLGLPRAPRHPFHLTLGRRK